LASLLVS